MLHMQEKEKKKKTEQTIYLYSRDLYGFQYLFFHQNYQIDYLKRCNWDSVL